MWLNHLMQCWQITQTTQTTRNLWRVSFVIFFGGQFFFDQLALVPAKGRQCQAMLILVCWAMLILFLPGIVIRIKPQYLSDILKHFQFESQKKTMNQIKFLSTSVNTTFVVKVLFCSYWSCSAWWPVLCAC